MAVDRDVLMRLTLKMQGATELKGAFGGIINDLARSEAALERLNAALDPDAVRARVQMSQQMDEAQRKLNDALKEEADRYPAFAEKAITDEERRLAAMRKVNEEIDRRAQAKVEKGMGPLAEEATTDEDRRLAAMRKVNEEIDRRAQAKVEKGMGPLAEEATTDEERRVNALRQINQQLEVQRQRQIALKEFNSPERIKQRVEGEKRLEEQEKKYNKALDAERYRRGGGFLGALGRDFSSGRAPAAILGRVLGGGVGQLLGAGLGAGGGAGGLAGLSAAAGGPFGLIVAGLDMVSGAARKFMDFAKGMVSQSNPFLVERLNYAWDRVYATIGHRLEPVLEIFTQGIRNLGDFLNTILPSQKELDAALAPFRDVMREATGVMADMAPLIREVLVLGLQEAAASMRTLGVVAKEFNEARAKHPTLMAALFPPLAFLGAPGKNELTPAMHPARQASFSSVEEYLERQHAAAYSRGADPATDTARNTAQAVTFLQEILDAIRSGNRAGGPGTREGAIAGAAEGLWAAVRRGISGF